MIRAFVGLPLPWDAADLLARRAAGIGAGRPIAAENLHLTLLFLDDQPEGALADLHDELALIRSPALSLRWGPPDFFGGDRTRVFALTVAPDPALTALYARVRAAARAAGIATGADRFRPHVSLIRLPGRIDPAAQARLQGLIGRGVAEGLPPAPVARLCLYRSHLDRGGAWYEELADYHLSDSPGAGGLDAGGISGP